MTVRSQSFLYTRRTGPEDGPPFLLLHDRFGTLDDAAALAAHIGQDSRAIAVRAPRTQTVGAHGDVFGYYWYFGDRPTPELSTLGDALFQLETLLLENAAAAPSGKIGIVGRGEGGVIALLIALLWPEKLSQVIAIDAELPANLDDLPITRQKLDGLAITLIAPPPATANATREILAASGADVTVREADITP